MLTRSRNLRYQSAEHINSKEHQNQEVRSKVCKETVNKTEDKVTTSVIKKSVRGRFVLQLWKLVNDKETNHVISWTPRGKSFVIKKHAEFLREVLPKYYKNISMTNFVNKLNRHGFQRVNVRRGYEASITDKIEYSHSHFIRNRPDLVKHMKSADGNMKPLLPNVNDGETDTKLSGVKLCMALTQKRRTIILSRSRRRSTSEGQLEESTKENDEESSQETIEDLFWNPIVGTSWKRVEPVQARVPPWKLLTAQEPPQESSEETIQDTSQDSCKVTVLDTSQDSCKETNLVTSQDSSKETILETSQESSKVTIVKKKYQKSSKKTIRKRTIETSEESSLDITDESSLESFQESSPESSLDVSQESAIDTTLESLIEEPPHIEIEFIDMCDSGTFDGRPDIFIGSNIEVVYEGKSPSHEIPFNQL